jgi:dienelactone hydrolase
MKPMNQLRFFPVFYAFLVWGLLVFPVIRLKGSVSGVSGKPVIFNYNEGALPGELLSVQGSSFGTDAELWYAVINGQEEVIKPQKPLPVTSKSDHYLAAVLPDEKILPLGSLIAVWVKNGEQISEPAFVNRARIVTVEFEEIMPAYVFRVFGRNLFFRGHKPELTFYDAKNDQSIPAVVIQADQYILQVKAPETIRPGVRYVLKVTNGSGGKWGISQADETILARESELDPFSIGTTWGADFRFYKNVYNIKTDSRLRMKAKGDGKANDRVAIQQAIDKASDDGGGVVYLPKGNYKLDFVSGCGLSMRSNVVLKGDGAEVTVIQYGFGTPPPYPDPIGKSGWPDETVEGVVLLWPLGTKLSGLSDLCIRNVNKTGLWRHSLKTMRPKEKRPAGAGSGYFAVNCRFDLSVAWGLSWAYIDKMVVANCDFESHAQITWPWLWHCDGSTNFVMRNNRIHYSAGRFGFNESYNGIIENNHITRLGDLQTFKGETGGFNIDYAKDIVVLKNRMDVDGTPIADRNMGETILSQGGNPAGQTLGTIDAATETSIIDSKQVWPVFGTSGPDYKGDVNASVPSCSNAVAIISGNGAGQWRYISGENTSNTMQIDRPWDVVPEKGSQYVVMKWSAEDWLVKDNVLENNNRGIWFYCGGHDVVIEGNQLVDSEGIYLRADQRKEMGRFNLIWNILVENNRVFRETGKRPAYICSVLAIQKTHALLGTGTIGVEIRRNLVQTRKPNVASFVPGEGYWNEVRSLTPEALGNKIGILGTVFDNNTAINCDYGYRLSKSVSHTTIKNPVCVDVTNLTNSSSFPESDKIGTVLITGDEKPVSENDPFAQYLTGQAPEILKDLGEETGDGVRVHKLIFHSYNYKSGSGNEKAQIFAAVVRPEKPGKYPGLLVLHGGGGNAEIDKAKKWAALGYVVVVLDEPGVANPDKIPFSHGPWDNYKYGENRFVTRPDITSSTIFSAVLSSVQGLYLLYSQPDVIKDKIGIVGISWGGYLTTIVSGLANPLIKASFSVYGSGFYDDGSVFLKNLNVMDPWERATWLKYLDAGRRVSSIKTPFFIAAAANDNWFYPPAVTSTLKNSKGPVSHLFAPNNSHKVELPGGTEGKSPEEPGWLAMERIYFDYYLKGIGQPFPKIQEIKTEKSSSGNTQIKFKVSSPTEIASGQVCYSPVGVEWPKRKWEIIPATASADGWYVAEIPSNELKQPFECYATVSDSRPISVSSYLVWCE